MWDAHCSWKQVCVKLNWHFISSQKTETENYVFTFVMNTSTNTDLVLGPEICSLNVEENWWYPDMNMKGNTAYLLMLLHIILARMLYLNVRCQKHWFFLVTWVLHTDEVRIIDLIK
jgi:hypothetical protein